MSEFQFTHYFENKVLPQRPYLTKEICIRVIRSAVRCEPQEHNRFRFWGSIPELGGRFLRVVTLEDQRTSTTLFSTGDFAREAQLLPRYRFALHHTFHHTQR